MENLDRIAPNQYNVSSNMVNTFNVADNAVNLFDDYSKPNRSKLLSSLQPIGFSRLVNILTAQYLQQSDKSY